MGTLTLAGNSAHTGATINAGGTLRLDANSAAGTGLLRVASGTFALNGFEQTVAGLTFGDGSATAAATVSGPGTLTVNGDISFQGAPGNTTAPSTLASNVSLGAGNHTLVN